MTWAPNYATVAELRDYLRIGDNADNGFLAVWVATVSRNVDDHCGRQFGKADTPVTRYYTPRYDRHEGAWFADIDDLQDTTGLAFTAEDGSTVTGYTLLPRNAAADGKPYEQVKLTAATGELAGLAPWGWNTPPAAVRTGLFLQGARLAARRDSPFGIAGSPSEGSEIRLLAQLDPDFKTSLKPYVRKWWAA
ncbi:hypothetical protein ACQPZX_41440 [Actinoplanes sp. CA-142083]|uniref:hypothetical protein n=1 Tax=Actinoplanes sp. CA-142083 TaxID=3239903 RepID=UPI003D91A65A